MGELLGIMEVKAVLSKRIFLLVLLQIFVILFYYYLGDAD